MKLTWVKRIVAREILLSIEEDPGLIGEEWAENYFQRGPDDIIEDSRIISGRDMFTMSYLIWRAEIYDFGTREGNNKFKRALRKDYEAAGRSKNYGWVIFHDFGFDLESSERFPSFS